MLEKFGKWAIYVGAVGGFILGVGVGFYVGTSGGGVGEGSIKELQDFWASDGNSENLSDLDSGQQEESGGYILVELSGAVNSPGVYKLLPDSRVADLIKVGEGVSNEASARWLSKNVNLSYKLTDGSKVYVPFEWEILQDLTLEVSPFVDNSGISTGSGSGVSESSSSKGIGADEEENDMKVNVNTSTSTELETLPGIGPVTASRIINSRPYVDESDLKERAKISDSVMEKIKDLIIF